MPHITVAGSAAVWDYIFPVDRLPEKGDIVSITRDSDEAYPGGCAPNIAAGVAALSGYRPNLYYPVGCEFQESGLKDVWAEKGIDCSELKYRSDVKSGYAWMFMQPDGSTMCFSYAGAAKGTVPASLERLGEWVVVTPMLNEFTLTILKEIAGNKSKKLILTGICSEGIIEFLESAYAVIINIHEAKILADLKGYSSIDELADSMGETILYITHGGNGSRVYYQGESTPIPIVQADKVLDFTGAGDAYTSGVVSGLVRGLTPVEAAYIGATNSSFVVEDFGGQSNLPSLELLKERLASYAPEIVAKVL